MFDYKEKVVLVVQSHTAEAFVTAILTSLPDLFAFGIWTVGHGTRSCSQISFAAKRELSRHDYNKYF